METNGIENPRIASERKANLQNKDSVTDKMVENETVKSVENNKVPEAKDTKQEELANKHNSESSEKDNKHDFDDNAANLLDGLKLDTKLDQEQQPIVLPAELELTSSMPTSTSSTRLKRDHPLRHHWTFWYLDPKKDLDWLTRLHEICTITTVEEFWALYDNIRRPSSLIMGCDYNFFRKGIEPVWEVPENKMGGRLIAPIDKDKGRSEALDIWWLELLLALVGEQFQEDAEQISGAVCMVRQKGSKICLWTQNSQNEDVNRRIGLTMKNRFSESVSRNISVRINYEEHNAAQNKSSSAMQFRFTI